MSTTSVTDVLNKQAGTFESNGVPAATDGMGKDEFLKLLLAQLNNQDPLAPAKNEEFIAQLATFSSLEQLVNINERLDALNVTQASQTSATAVSFIGKDVRAIGDWVDYDGGGTASVNYELLGAAEEVTVTVKDEDGKVLLTKTLGKQEKGDHEWAWDGKNKDGSPMKEGTYSVSLSAKDANGGEVRSFPIATGRITGITFENGYPELMIGEHKISLSDIIKVMEE